MKMVNIVKDKYYSNVVEVRFSSPVKIRVQYSSGIIRSKNGSTMIYPSETFENVIGIKARVGTMYIGGYHSQEYTSHPCDGDPVHYYSLEIEKADGTTVEINICMNFFADDPQAETLINGTKKILQEWADKLFE